MRGINDPVQVLTVAYIGRSTKRGALPTRQEVGVCQKTIRFFGWASKFGQASQPCCSPFNWFMFSQAFFLRHMELTHACGVCWILQSDKTGMDGINWINTICWKTLRCVFSCLVYWPWCKQLHGNLLEKAQQSNQAMNFKRLKLTQRIYRILHPASKGQYQWFNK